ncbi:DBF4-type zinc finger-containing protein 2 [Erethizon dorsatum]
MQKRQGYCTYCRVIYTNLEQHLFSAQHRSVTRQSRERLINNNSLMERFLQDVLRHHPYNYQDIRAQYETPARTVSPEVIRLDEFFPEDAEIEEISSESPASVEDSRARPGVPQNSAKEVSVRPSVIQKLERGQQQSLEFNKIESCVRKVNPVDIGQASNSGKSVIRPPVICNAPASCLPGTSHARPVAPSTSRIPVATRSESVSKCNPSRVDKVEQLDEGPRNHMPSCRPKTSSVSYENPKESNKKSVHGNLNKLSYQKDVKCQGEILSPAFQFRDLKDAKSSVRVESSSKGAVSPIGKLNKPDVPPARRISEGAIPKRRGQFPSQMGRTREEKRTARNKTAVSKRKGSVRAKVKFDRSSLQAASVPARKSGQKPHLRKEEQGDREGENRGSRGSETSFDHNSFSPSPTDLSEVTARKINVSEEALANLQDKSNKDCDSEISSEDERDDSLHVVANQSQVIVKAKTPPKATRISLVDESYDSSGSEINFDCDNSAEPTDVDPQQPHIDVIFPNGVPIDLVDRSYGSGSSKGSAASVASLESVVEGPPGDVTKKKCHTKPHICLVDKSYGSSYSDSSSDSDGSPRSADDRPRMTGAEGNRKGRPVQLKNKKCKPSSAKAHLSCGGSLEAVSHRAQREVGGIKLLKKKSAGLVDMNCESHAPDMGFRADAQLVADESQVAVKEVNPQAVDTDLENNSVRSSISDLSFESHDCLYQSANDELEGDLGEVNLKELNVDMEARSSGSSSSELTFDSDSPLSVTERSQLDVERLKEDPFNLEEESWESDSSDLTFDSDIPTCSVVDQPQVAVYEEEPVDLENESDESCVSEITFDSDIPLHSGNEQREVAVKEVIIQEEEYIPLERKNAKPSGSEINSDSYTPLHSVTNPPEVAIKKLSSQKEEQVHLNHKENGPTDSELNLNRIFHSTTGHSEDLINDRNLQKEECVHLENKHNEASVSGTPLDSDIPLLSVIHKPQVVVKNVWLHKEKQADFQGKIAEFSASEIKPNVPHCPVMEPQVSLKKKEKKKHIEKKTDKYGDSELTLNSDDLPQSMPKNPPLGVLQEDLVYPEDESPQCRGFEANMAVIGSLCSVPDQPHLILLKKTHVDLKDKSSKPSDSKISFSSDDHLQSLPGQYHKVINKINLWKEEAITLQNKIDAPSCSKTIHTSHVPLKPAADHPEVAVQLISQGKEGQVRLGNKSKSICSEMNLDSDFLVQAIIDRPHIAVEKSEGEGKRDQSGDSEGNSASAASVQPVADQPRDTVKETAPGKDESVDIESKRGAAEGFDITHDSDVLQPVTGQTKVIQEMKLWKKHLDLEHKNVRPSDSKINSDSSEPLQSLTNKIQEPIKEANLPGKGHVCLYDKGYEPDGSEIIYVSNVPLRSVIQQPQGLQEKRATLEMDSSDSRSITSFNSNEPCQSVSGQLQKTVQEMNLKEGHIYLEDKSYKLVGFEASYDSEIPVQFVVDPSHVSAKEINVQEEDPNDLENESYKVCSSEAKCDSGIHLQSEVDPPQVACRETSFQNKELFDMEEKASEPSDSEILYDSDVSFQIIVNQSQSSDGEADSPEVVFVDVVASDSDCDHEVISDPDVPLQLVTDLPQLTIEETRCVHEKPVEVGKRYCAFCGSELRFEASFHSVTNQSVKTFRIVNRKNDYIILGDSTCQSCGCEIDFNAGASGPSVSYQAQGPGKEYLPSRDKRCGSNGPKGNFHFEGTSQKTDHDGSLQKDPNYTGLNEKSWESGGSAVDYAASAESVIHHTADTENLSELKRATLASRSGTSYSSQVDFQHDPPIQADTEQPQEAVKRMRPRKRVTFDPREYHYYPSSSVSVVASVKNLDEEPEVIEDDPSAADLEVLPPISPSVVGETWLQKVRGDDDKTDHLVKDFRKGHFHGYSHADYTTKKVFLSETEPTWPDSNQNTTSAQTPPDSDRAAGGTADTDDVSVALDRSRRDCPLAVEHLEQNWHLASQNQALKVNHATQTNSMNYPLKKRKITGHEEEPPKRKCSQSDRKGKQSVPVVTVGIPTSRAKALEPGQRSSLVCAPPADAKRKEGESSSSLKKKWDACDNQLQFMERHKQNNLDPLPEKVVINPPQNPVVPGSADTRNGSNGNYSTGGNNAPAQNLAPKAFITTARYKLRSRCGSNESCVLLESIDNVNIYEPPKNSNFQATPSNDGAKASPKPVTDEYFESKSKKIPKKKAKTKAKRSSPQSIYKAVILQEKTQVTSEKQSIWIRTKANAIIKKYTLKYSILLSPRDQTRTTVFAVNPKKKIPDGIRPKKRREASKMFLNSSVPRACFEERFSAVTGPSRKKLVLRSSSTAGRNKLADKTYTYKKKTPILVREYDLRSSCYGPTGSRMATRLSSKQSFASLSLCCPAWHSLPGAQRILILGVSTLPCALNLFLTARLQIRDLIQDGRFHGSFVSLLLYGQFFSLSLHLMVAGDVTCDSVLGCLLTARKLLSVIERRPVADGDSSRRGCQCPGYSIL